MKLLAIIALAFAIASPAAAKVVKKHGANQVTRECKPPKRWIEVDALADDAERRSKVVCK